MDLQIHIFWIFKIPQNKRKILQILIFLSDLPKITGQKSLKNWIKCLNAGLKGLYKSKHFSLAERDIVGLAGNRVAFMASEADFEESISFKKSFFKRWVKYIYILNVNYLVDVGLLDHEYNEYIDPSDTMDCLSIHQLKNCPLHPNVHDENG